MTHNQRSQNWSPFLMWSLVCMVPGLVGMAIERGIDSGPATFSAMLLALPVVVSTSSRRKTDVRITLGLSSAFLAIDAWAHSADHPAASVWPGVIVAILALTLIAFVLRKKLRPFDVAVSPLNLDLTDRDAETLSRLDAASRMTRSNQEVNHQYEFAMMLMAMQDISRRLSARLEKGLLLTEIISICETLLSADGVRIFLHTETSDGLRLVAASDSKSGTGSRCPMDSANPLAQWVCTHRRVLTGNKLSEVASSMDGFNSRNLPSGIAPLAVGEEALGLIVIDQSSAAPEYLARLLYMTSHLSSLGLKTALLFERIKEMARRDGLTGLLNHATFQTELANRTGADFRSPVSVIIGDIDHFKKFNDEFGHPAGDQVLRDVAKCWQAIIPDSGLTARYGGEEFVAIVPYSAVDAAALTETLRQTIADIPISHEGQALTVTSSFGIAECRGTEDCGADIIKRADEALYQSKRAGRNRVTLSASDSKSNSDSNEN